MRQNQGSDGEYWHDCRPTHTPVDAELQAARDVAKMAWNEYDALVDAGFDSGKPDYDTIAKFLADATRLEGVAASLYSLKQKEAING